MFPDGKSSEKVVDFYVWNEGKQAWDKIGKSINFDLTVEKESAWKRFWRKIRSFLKGIW